MVKAEFSHVASRLVNFRISNFIKLTHKHIFQICVRVLDFGFTINPIQWNCLHVLWLKSIDFFFFFSQQAVCLRGLRLLKPLVRLLFHPAEADIKAEQKESGPALLVNQAPH